VTGMSGTGKSTVLEELRRRGYYTVDTDHGDWEQAQGVWDERCLAASVGSNMLS
jgi:dephospho-CoA kinase